MLIAQLSDLHFTASGGAADGRPDPHAALDAAIFALRRGGSRPDILLVTGDLAERGDVTDYQALAERFSRLGLPVYVVPGNHDDPAAMRGILHTHQPAPEASHGGYAIDTGTLILIGLDSVRPGWTDGALGKEQISWLDRTLVAAAGRAVLIFMHHPPIRSGLEAMDRCGLLVGRDAFAAVLARHRERVVAVLCGHLHRSVQGMFAGVSVRVAPAVVHQVAFDLRPGAPMVYCLEPPQFMLHHWDGEDGLLSHTIYVECFPGLLST